MASKTKTKEDKKEKDSEEKEEKQTSNKNIYWTLGAIVLLVGVFFGSYFIFGNLNKFEYNGLTFTKEKFGDIPVFHYYYYYNADDQLYRYNLYLRNDPRENNVPFTGMVLDDGIEFSQSGDIYISLDPEESIVGCEYGGAGISSLASFLSDNQLDVKSASTTEKEAIINQVKHVTCDNIHPSDVAIIVKSGLETKIIHEKTNCHVIEIANCEVLEGVEKFLLESVIDARTRSGL